MNFKYFFLVSINALMRINAMLTRNNEKSTRKLSVLKMIYRRALFRNRLAHAWKM